MRHLLRLTVCLIGLFCAGAGVARADILPCQPLKGIEALFARSEAHIVWTGEMHGTSEMPALFGDMVCAAGADGHAVVVVLERLPAEADFWNMFLGSDGRDEARGLLLMGLQWRNPLQDGRSSAAMLDLADRLRRLKQAGRIQTIEFADRFFDTQTPRDAQMAQAVMDIRAKYPEARILVFTGNFHAMKNKPGGFQTAASLLPPSEIVSVNILGEAGKTWSIQEDDAGEHGYWGKDHPREIVPTVNDPAYDFIAYTGMPTTPSAPAMAEGLALIRPLLDAYGRVEAEQAKLPPATTDRERLERMGAIDQAGRSIIVKLDYATIPAFQRQPARTAEAEEMKRYDLQNQTALKAMLPKTGWFLKSQYGRDATNAAFLIVQHAMNDPDLMRLALDRMAPLIGTGEINDQQYALLYDRITLYIDHKPQRYGSQVICQAGKWVPDKTEAPEQLDARRKTVGLPGEDEYLKLFADHACH